MKKPDIKVNLEDMLYLQMLYASANNGFIYEGNLSLLFGEDIVEVKQALYSLRDTNLIELVRLDVIHDTVYVCADFLNAFGELRTKKKITNNLLVKEQINTDYLDSLMEGVTPDIKDGKVLDYHYHLLQGDSSDKNFQRNNLARYFLLVYYYKYNHFPCGYNKGKVTSAFGKEMNVSDMSIYRFFEHFIFNNTFKVILNQYGDNRYRLIDSFFKEGGSDVNKLKFRLSDLNNKLMLNNSDTEPMYDLENRRINEKR